MLEEMLSDNEVVSPRLEQYKESRLEQGWAKCSMPIKFKAYRWARAFILCPSYLKIRLGLNPGPINWPGLDGYPYTHLRWILTTVADSLVNQAKLNFGGVDSNKTRVAGFSPFYTTDYGAAYWVDSLELLKSLPDNSINLVLTSPPYALHFKEEYGNVDKDQYVLWFLDFAREIIRVLKDDGSFILNIGGSYNKGEPTRSLYHFKLLIALVEEVGFYLAQECFWYNPAKMPTPAEWVNVRRIRIKDSVEYIWWLSKTPWPKASNLNVLAPYSRDMIRLN